MKSVKTVLIVIILIFNCIFKQVYSQNREDRNRIIEIEMERILEDLEEELNSDDADRLSAILYDLIENPVDLNSAGMERLLLLPGVHSGQAAAIISYRKDVQSFEKVEDLLNVSGIGPATLMRIKPLVTVFNPENQRTFSYLRPGKWFRNGQFDLFTRYRRVLEKQHGYTVPDSLGGYLGSQAGYYQRFGFRSDHASLNLTQQKVPGEMLQKPFSYEHSSWHASLRNLGRLYTVIAGDFNIRLGHGLLLNNRPTFGKGRNVIRSLRPSGTALRGFTSARSDQAFRGVAFSTGWKWNVTGFYSNKKRTATVVTGDTIRFPAVNLNYNRSTAIDRKDNTRQITKGGRLGYQRDNFSFGISGFVNRFNRPVASGVRPYQLYAFHGTSVSGASFDFNYQSEFLGLFGETAATNNKALGLFTALLITPVSGTDLAISWRHYEPGLQAIFGSQFSEQSGSPRNERGFYLALRHNLTKNLVLSGFSDFFHFPAPRFQADIPTNGFDWFTSIEYRPNSLLSLDLSVRQKIREEQYRTTDEWNREIYHLAERKRTIGRINFSHQVHPQVRIRFRTELIRSVPPGSEPETGYLFYQDIRWNVTDWLQLDARATYFDTGGFESRFYHFENDLLYLFSNTMLFDQGQRLYVLVNIRPSDSIQIWFKAATTIYENRLEIGSGPERIEGNRKSDIGVQVRIRI